MKGEDGVLRHLNEILRGELTAINQYFLHARMCADWGFSALAKHEYDESIEEMKHAQTLTDRILFLKGLPNLQDLGRLRIGENPQEVLRADLQLENEAIPKLREAIAHCETQRDFVTRDLLRDILSNEEEHADWLETQLGLMDRLGMENYLQSQV